MTFSPFRPNVRLSFAVNTVVNTLTITPAAPAAHTFTSSAALALTLLGPSTAIAQLWSQMRRLAPHMRTLLLTGLADCGQEAIARLMLDLSPQPRRQFLVLPSCEVEQRLEWKQTTASLPAELFLFLPDADQLTPDAQASLLQFLRTRRTSATTVVAAVSDNLKTLVSLGRFSAELAEVLGAVRIAVPALKERAEDVPMLLNQMISMRCQNKHRSVAQITEPVLRAAMQHDWSGNLRELSETADELIRLTGSRSEIGLAEWTRALNMHRLPKASPVPARMIRLDMVIQEHIYSVLRACSGNKQKAADVLGVSRSTLYRMLELAARETPLALAS